MNGVAMSAYQGGFLFGDSACMCIWHFAEWPFLILRVLCRIVQSCSSLNQSVHSRFGHRQSITIVGHRHGFSRVGKAVGKNVCISARECTFARRVTQPDIPILFFDITFAQKPKGRQIFKTAPPYSSTATTRRKNNYLQYIRFFSASPLEMWVDLLRNAIFHFFFHLDLNWKVLRGAIN